jgi:hypothetical protein
MRLEATGELNSPSSRNKVSQGEAEVRKCSSRQTQKQVVRFDDCDDERRTRWEVWRQARDGLLFLSGCTILGGEVKVTGKCDARQESIEVRVAVALFRRFAVRVRVYRHSCCLMRRGGGWFKVFSVCSGWCATFTAVNRSGFGLETLTREWSC